MRSRSRVVRVWAMSHKAWLCPALAMLWKNLLADADLERPHCWVMGNEAWGLPEAVQAACDEVVRIPIYGKAESLNLAMAATLCVYASAGARLGRRST